jgi:hypothetical protein
MSNSVDCPYFNVCADCPSFCESCRNNKLVKQHYYQPIPYVSLPCYPNPWYPNIIWCDNGSSNYNCTLTLSNNVPESTNIDNSCPEGNKHCYISI